MTDTFLNKINMEYLSNKDQYNKSFVNLEVTKINKKDKKFYKKRTFNLVKELLMNNEPLFLSPNVKHDFNVFLNSSIEYFKVLDSNDIIQADLKGHNNIDVESINAESIDDNIINENNVDNLLMRSLNINNNSLDKFIKIKKNYNEIIIPIQKDINLSDPILRIKGIPKKKNIINKYEENKKEVV